MMGIYRDKIAGMFSKKHETSLPVNDAEYTVFDTELTGLDLKKDSIISIGALKMKGGRIDLGSSFYRLTNPAAGVDHNSVLIHGIMPSDVVGKPPVDDILNEFIDYCGSSILVGHFVSLDMSFINKELKRIGAVPLKNPTVDTCRAYEWIRSQDSSFSRHYAGRTEDLDLFTLAREYSIPVSEGHNALGDAFITAQLFQRFLSVMPGLGVHTVGDLVRIGKP